MKEMVGGCCVCGDENGWLQNPLVYCDGRNCDVAVHQGCYGILKVPDGSWFCAKCSVNDGLNSTIRCDLCPFGYGAMKRTDKGGWAHVICALYIPEVQFGDVNSMDPVILGSVPEEKFKQSCYLCEENKDLMNLASIGACMLCNKIGCKRYFHVTCAQRNGFLCEESGGGGGNKSGGVKYVGYCSTHAKRAQNDSLIKIVPPYRPVIPSTSSGGSGQSTPDSNPLLMTSSLSKERRKNGPSSSPKDTKTNNGSNNNHLVNCVISTPNSMIGSTASTSVRYVNGPTEDPNPLMASSSTLNNSHGQAVLLMASSASPLSSAMTTITRAPEFPSPTSASTFPPVVTATLPATTTIAAGPAVPKVTSGKRGRPPGSGRSFIDGDDRPKRARKNTTKRTVKTLLELVNPVVQDTVSDFQRERVQQGVAATTSTLFSSSGAAPLPPTCTPVITPQLPGPSHVDTPLPGIAALAESYAPIGVPLKPTPKLGLLSPDSQNIGTSGQHTFPTSLEQLLERQWEQGSQFLMEQAQHFDIASLLSCLHQLKVENSRLEETIVSLAGRRDHLLAVNARLSLALGHNHTQSSPHVSPRVNSAAAVHPSMQDSSLESSPGSALTQLRHMTTTTVSPPSQVSLQAKNAHTQATSINTAMVSPSSRSVGSAPQGGYANVGSGSSVFTSVGTRQTNVKTGPDGPSPERMSVSNAAFLMPRTPTPLIPSGSASTAVAATTLAALSSHYPPVAQQEQMLQQLVLQQHAAAAYASLIPPPSSPQRAVMTSTTTGSHLNSNSGLSTNKS